MDGTALYYALSNPEWITPIGSFLLYNLPPLLLTVLTFATLGLEAFGPFLLFCPILTGPVRTGAIPYRRLPQGSGSPRGRFYHYLETVGNDPFDHQEGSGKLGVRHIVQARSLEGCVLRCC